MPFPTFSPGHFQWINTKENAVRGAENGKFLRFSPHYSVSCCLAVWARERENHQQTQDPHMSSKPGFEPGPHWWEASVLTTVPSLPYKGKIAVAPLSPAQAGAWYPCENSNKRAGDYGKTLPLFPFPSSPARLLFSLFPSPPATQRSLCEGVSSHCLNFGKFRQWHNSFNQCVNIVAVIRWTYQGGQGRLWAGLPSVFWGRCTCLSYCQIIPWCARRRNDTGEISIAILLGNTVKPALSGHPWGMANWLLNPLRSTNKFSKLVSIHFSEE